MKREVHRDRALQTVRHICLTWHHTKLRWVEHGFSTHAPCAGLLTLPWTLRVIKVLCFFHFLPQIIISRVLLRFEANDAILQAFQQLGFHA